jgi:hypothetical protein
MAALQLGPGAESLAVHELKDGGAPPVAGDRAVLGEGLAAVFVTPVMGAYSPIGRPRGTRGPGYRLPHRAGVRLGHRAGELEGLAGGQDLHAGGWPVTGDS